MKGTVTNWKNTSSWGFVLGDDGQDYFLHKDDMNFNKCHVGNRVEFDIVEDSNGRPRNRAVNVNKLSHGKAHPFIRDLERIESLFREYVPDSNEEKKYALRDFQMLYRYFSAIEDVKEHPNVRYEFRDRFKEEIK